ncbi:WXG100 family type VII secretion target [Aliarcobacter butzleri]|uniref:WXG100 family type VII secretion target n=1 Tax=Aliarcobacter butzleri TaxID=28197 RepID=UPI00102DC840|nr:WXG100 family type VII secretion target [Aliarcobacter butzleri]MCG3701576.1 WXG100 family type VII secretion target [Aliarcobacter butzleri]RZV16521.1 WXG100 family type VII secretion target [Aliarcobacter butzleri]
MAQVNINPDELEQFVYELHNYLEALQNATGRLNHSFETLSGTWQDSKKVQFEETYRELLQVLRTFENNANEQIPYLKKLVSIQRNYETT